MRVSGDSAGFSAKPRRRVVLGRLAGPALFIVTEVWAFVELVTQVRVAGMQAAALALVLSGVLLKMWSEWQEIRARPSPPVRAQSSAPCAEVAVPSADAA